MQPAKGISEELIQELNRSFDLELGPQGSTEELEDRLASRLNRLIDADFNALVSILYRVDVSETKLKELLSIAAGVDAGRIMARLIIERQLQKIITRGSAGTSQEEGPAWKEV